MIAHLLRAHEQAILRAIVADLEREYVGGTPFFDALDATLRTPEWFEIITDAYLEAFPSHPRMVVSGAFGLAYVYWLSKRQLFTPRVLDIPGPVVIPGNLRHVTAPDLTVDLTGETLVFLDDSIFKGRTFGQAQSLVRKAGGELEEGIVIYDGSHEHWPTIFSFYRYHWRD